MVGSFSQGSGFWGGSFRGGGYLVVSLGWGEDICLASNDVRGEFEEKVCACCARIYARPLALGFVGLRGELSID